jgi:biotin carboxylase
MPKHKIAVLHGEGAVSPLEVYRHVRDVAELIWVVDQETSAEPNLTRLLRKTGAIVDSSGLDEDGVARQLARHGTGGIVTFVDDRLELAARLAERLELPYHSPKVAALCVDKRLQRAALHRAGLPGPRFWPVEDGAAPSSLARLAREVAFPVVVKPCRGSGSRGIRLLRTPEELLDMASDQPRAGFVLEELLADADHEPWVASFLSVESTVVGGEISHVALTGRFPLAEPFRETGNFVPALIADATREAVLRLATSAIEALGVTYGVTHTELKLTPDGPRLLEVNGRLGGVVPFILERVSGVNLFQAVCQVATGARASFDKPVACSGVAFWWHEQPPTSARIVRSVRGVEELASLDTVEAVTVDRGPGQAVDWHAGYASRVATVRGWGPDHASVAAAHWAIKDLLRVDYE